MGHTAALPRPSWKGRPLSEPARGSVEGVDLSEAATSWSLSSGDLGFVTGLFSASCHPRISKQWLIERILPRQAPQPARHQPQRVPQPCARRAQRGLPTTSGHPVGPCWDPSCSRVTLGRTSLVHIKHGIKTSFFPPWRGRPPPGASGGGGGGGPPPGNPKQAPSCQHRARRGARSHEP